MLHQTLDKIYHLLSKSPLTEKQKQQLSTHYQELQQELTQLAEIDSARAQIIASDTHKITEAALAEKTNRDLFKRSERELRKSVEYFEASHPRLSALLQTIMTHLASSGI